MIEFMFAHFLKTWVMFGVLKWRQFFLLRTIMPALHQIFTPKNCLISLYLKQCLSGVCNLAIAQLQAMKE